MLVFTVQNKVHDQYHVREHRPKPRDVVSTKLLRVRFRGGFNGVAPHKGALLAGYARRSAALN
jgi:hypothetical protein